MSRPRCRAWVVLGILGVACSGGLAGPRTGDPSSGQQLRPVSEGRQPATAAPYRPDRRDYASFREAYPGLLEPNYLPFMVHRFPRNRVVGDALVFCRWDAAQMPIRVAIPTPEIPESLQDEFTPIAPAAYVEAAEAALSVWERALEGHVRFQRVAEGGSGPLVIRLIGAPAPVPVPDKQRLGSVEKLADACRSQGWHPDADRMKVRFEVPELEIHLADDRGLLAPILVRRLVIHELGHVLGMKGHSPSPGDVMYPVLKDRPGRDELSLQDVNSFLSLYQLPNGAHYGDASPGEPAPRPPAAPPSRAPDVAMEPLVDTRNGYEMRVPAGWLRIEEPHGYFIANGPSWDYDVSLRIFVWPSPTIEHFLRCCSRRLLSNVWFRHRSEVVVKGRRTLRLLLEDEQGEVALEYLFAELGDGRVMLLLWESPLAHERAWRPWLGACLNSLEIW